MIEAMHPMLQFSRDHVQRRLDTGELPRKDVFVIAAQSHTGIGKRPAHEQRFVTRCQSPVISLVKLRLRDALRGGGNGEGQGCSCQNSGADHGAHSAIIRAKE